MDRAKQRIEARGRIRERIRSKVSGTAAFKTPGGNTLSSILLQPNPITKDNLNLVLEAGWVTKADLCQGVPAGRASACG